MTFLSLEIFVLLNFAFFIFIYLLPSFINERLHNTLLVLKERAIEYILIAIFWFYGFESFFCQVLIHFLFVYLLFFL